MFMSSDDYRESLRGLKPAVYVSGRKVESVADEELLAPGVNGIGLTYDYALREEIALVMRAEGQRKTRRSPCAARCRSRRRD